MKKNVSAVYDVKKVHIVNIITIVVIAVTLGALAIAVDGLNKGMITVYKSLFACAGMAVLYFTPIKDSIKAVILSLFPAGVAALNVLTNSVFPIGNHYLIIISIVMIALYFDKKLVLVYGAFINILMIILSFAGYKVFYVEQNFAANRIVIMMVFINITIYILYSLTNWGRALVENSIEKERKATELLEKLRITMNEMDKDSDKLNEGVVVFNKNINSTREGMANVNSAMHEMAKGITDQASDINTINEETTQMSSYADENLKISEEVAKHAECIQESVSKGSEKVEQMNAQMSIIYQAVNTSMVTVNQLNDDISNINNFLEGIRQISKQTNLLALNASIEAARAGEHGKGFAVVADEIRKLAGQSSKTVEDINNIINKIISQTTIVVDKARLGDDAAASGSEIIKSVNDYFNQIRDTFAKTSIALSKEGKMAEEMSDMFSKVHEKVEGIASISEEQAASIEEITATIESQNNDIISISKKVEEISELGENLKKLSK